LTQIANNVLIAVARLMRVTYKCLTLVVEIDAVVGARRNARQIYSDGPRHLQVYVVKVVVELGRATNEILIVFVRC